jgi:ATP:corrinoid adenosyltransferase
MKTIEKCFGEHEDKENQEFVCFFVNTLKSPDEIIRHDTYKYLENSSPHNIYDKHFYRLCTHIYHRKLNDEYSTVIKYSLLTWEQVFFQEKDRPAMILSIDSAKVFSKLAIDE